MPTWVPDDRDALDALAADLAAMFADAEQRLAATLAVQVAAGLQDGDVVKALNLAELRRDAERITGALRSLYPDQLERILAVAAEHGATAALGELADVAGLPDLTAAKVPAGTAAATALVADLTNALDDVTVRILRWPDDVYRRAVAQASTDLLLGLGATSKTVQARAWQQLVTQGVTGFTDVTGRRWNLATYVEMATRTAARRAWDDQHDGVLRTASVELVSIVVGSGACKRCADWAGKILRLDDGDTGRIRVPSTVDPDADVTVDVDGTVADARAAGWQHPNCRCRKVAYLPGLSVVQDVTTYSPEQEAARVKLRDLEVQVRKAKTDAAAAVAPEVRTAANAKVRDLQARIREHVADTGLMRQRDREQVSYRRRFQADGPTTTRVRPLPSMRRDR